MEKLYNKYIVCEKVIYEKLRVGDSMFVRKRTYNEALSEIEELKKKINLMDLKNISLEKEIEEIKKENSNLKDINETNSKLIVIKKELKETEKLFKTLNQEINILNDKKNKAREIINKGEKIKNEINNLETKKEVLAHFGKEYERRSKDLDKINQQILVTSVGLNVSGLSKDLTTTTLSKLTVAMKEQVKLLEKIIIVTNKKMTGVRLTKKSGVYNIVPIFTDFSNDAKRVIGFLMTKLYNVELEHLKTQIKYNNFEVIMKKLDMLYLSINELVDQTPLMLNEQYHLISKEIIKILYEFKLFEREQKERLRYLKEQERERLIVEKEIEAKLMELSKNEKVINKELKKLEKQIYTPDIERRILEFKNKLELIEKKRVEVEKRKQISTSGFVYIISNIGSLGENIYKIGMTRRLEPLDRIRELSGASLPYPYDVHAMILTDNAPKLENNLHKHLHYKRVNLVNNRKEFFNISIEEIKEAVLKYVDGDVVINDNKMAEQFYESQAIREGKLAMPILTEM